MEALKISIGSVLDTESRSYPAIALFCDATNYLDNSPAGIKLPHRRLHSASSGAALPRIGL